MQVFLLTTKNIRLQFSSKIKAFVKKIRRLKKKQTEK